MDAGDITISPGELRNRVEFQKPIDQDNDVGEEEIAYNYYCKSWAKVEPLSGKQYMEAKKEREELTYRVTVRYRPDITDDMRIKYTKGTTTKYFIIEDLINVLERNKKLEIICYEKVYRDVNGN